MLTTANRPHRSLQTRIIAIVVAMVAIAVVSQVLARFTAAPPQARVVAVDPQQPTVGDLDQGSTTLGSTDGSVAGISADADIARIRADIAFWGARVTRDRDDFISSNRLGAAEIELARSTGDLSAYLAAENAFDITLKRDPTNSAALGYKGSVLVSLHRFTDAAALARDVLARVPGDPVSLATLGDAELELGNISEARNAFDQVNRITPSAATAGRLGHLAFITGDPVTAVSDSRAATVASLNEGSEGERLAFYQYQLADVLISTGDRAGAAKAYAAALADAPNSFLAHSGLARVAAANGDLTEGIRQLTAAIDIVPQPEFLARRGDLYTMRAKPGDAKLAAADYATVEAIAKLAGEAASVYDRTLSLYLANHDLDAARAVTLAQNELVLRKDVYGFDAAAWALLKDGRASDADAAMTSALAFGTQDAKVYYHAGMIDIALGRTAQARTMLERSLALDPSFDPFQAVKARAALAKLP